jgi:CRISPR/Cas system type I-B associated protein Csh2 (Cas7 group RAMP superfamily)
MPFSIPSEAMVIARARYIGKRLGASPKNEAEHFIRCPACNGWIDCRDLGQVFEHEGTLPHPTQDQTQ